MRMSFIILPLIFFFTTTSLANQFTEKITVSFSNIELSEAIKQIQEKSNYTFFYDVNKTDLTQKVSLTAGNVDIYDAMKTMLKSTGLTFEITNRQIALIPNQKPSQQPKKIINGVVLDNSGVSVIGANVMEKGTTNGVITDVDGNFSLNVDENAVLIISYIGYVTQEVAVNNRRQISITLLEDFQKLEEVVVVGYGAQKRVNLTGSVASINSEALTVAPVANSTNALAGKLPGLIVIQDGGQPGTDNASLNIRGFNNLSKEGDGPLIIVDGVAAEFHTINPNMIESISVLKDGSAAIYGARAGNGVILVTTKRGVQQKPVITFSTDLTMQGITSMPQTVSAGQYAELMTEKWLNEGRDPGLVPFTEEQIQKYYDGTDPQYPNTNWYKELIRDWTPMQQYHLSIRGGSEKIKYYGFIGYTNQEAMWKKNGGGYERYNLQSNIDASISENLSFQLDLAAIIETDKYSVRARGAEWADFWSTLPTAPATLPDPTKVSFADGSGTGGAHVSTNYNLYGYDKRDNQNYKGTGALIYKVPGVSGLTAKVLVNAIMNYNKIKVFSKPVDFYTYDVASDIYTLAGSLGSTAQLLIADTRNLSITTQASLNYDKAFGNDHQISVLALFEGIDSNSDKISAGRDNFLSPSVEQLYAGDNSTAKNDGSASEDGRVSYVGRVNYSYKDRYLLEATLRADASARFSPAERWGYFPSFSAGWRISQEDFMQHANSLDNLKLRAGYGQSGNDNVGRFQYLSGYQLQGFAGYLIGDNPMKAIYSTGMTNPYLSWEEVEITNVGIDFSFMNRKIYGEVDAFYRKKTGIPAKKESTLPSTFGASLPEENLNSMDNRGFELLLGTHFEIKDFIFDVSGNVAWSRDKWVHYEEPEYTDPDNIRITKKSGNWSSRLFGYKSDGLFASQAEIDALDFIQDNNNNTTLRPGDVRFVDTNDDGRLDWRDQVELGSKYPNWTTGININARYKDFDFAALFQGAFAFYTDVWLLRSSTKVYSEEVYKLRWTETNNNTNALVPRIGGSSLNASASDYRYKKAGYLRLKSASLGYNVPKSALSKISVEQARISLSGTNLLTFDKLKKYNLDPESPFGSAGYYYPQQRTISLSLNVSF